jgi:hypothetical protein
MKKLYTILLITFVSINVFGQSGYRLDPGKINIWSTTTANNGGFPGIAYSGIENLVTLNANPYFSYDRVVGLKNTVNCGFSSYGAAIGISSAVTSPSNPTGFYATAMGNYAKGIDVYTYPNTSTESGYYTGVNARAVADGNFATNYGVYGYASGAGSTSTNYGIYGTANGSGSSATNYGIFASTSNTNSSSFAGFFNGKVHVNGTLSKSAGTFKIDHPLDPLNKYLSHSFVESPDMMNIYNGNITTDQDGRATVSLPDYFEALNMDFRYQLTVIGTFSQAIVMEEIKGNQFMIASDKPNVKVSWQVTGVRNDAYAKKNRVIPEQDKPDSEKGKYLNADAFGLPREESLHSVKSEEEIKKRDKLLDSVKPQEVIKK